MNQSFTFVFHAFISANKIHSSNILCRKSYRLVDVYLENISLRMFIVNDSRLNGYVQAVGMAVFDAADCSCRKLAHQTRKQGFYRQKTLIT